MFNDKQKELFTVPNKGTANPVKNAFIQTAKKESAKTLSGNGAVKFDSTGDEFVDQFGKMGGYKAPRTYADISKDISTLWAKNPRMAICFTFFLRMITRIISLFDGKRTTSVQRGSGLKHEGILRMMWISINHPETFWKNIHLFISVGSWKDIIAMLSYDLQYNGWKNKVLHWDNFGKLLLAGLENPNTSELVKKYLPQIKANSKCTTLESQADNMIAKWICSLLFGSKDLETYQNYKKYRKLKSTGTAHQWQQLISQGKHNLINFDTVHGRALALLVSGKYITNNKLEDRYEKWIESKPVAKFTGYVNELFAKIPTKKFQIDTLNKQFLGLVETAMKGAVDGTSFIIVRDISGSMGSIAPGTKQSCFDIGKALALFFSYMLPKGYFANNYIQFHSTARMCEWQGSTPLEKWNNDRASFVGGTNFQSVIGLFCQIKSQGVPESEFPTGIVCISDSEFNPTQLGRTNVEQALISLKQAGFTEDYVSKFKIVLWNLQNSYYGKGSGEKFETYGDVDNVYYFSGYDGAIIAFLTGVKGQTTEPKNARELFEAAMDQEVLNMIEV